MIKPGSSLFTKILCWFFLNLTLLGVALSIFFAFQPQMNLYAVFKQQGSNRLRIASMLIAYDIEQAPQSSWRSILTRHAKINQVDFALVVEDGTSFSSINRSIPDAVIKKAKEILRLRSPWSRFPLSHITGIQDSSEKEANNTIDGLLKDNSAGIKPLMDADAYAKKPHLMMRTENPVRYWSGIKIPLFREPLHPPVSAVIVAVSDSVTGHGFFFDPIPWMLVAATVILISVLMWIPMVRNITKPLARMTAATELIAKGRFDVSISELRADEIGRLANAINHMTSRLSDFVKGQQRFLGDVAHELNSPIARIHFGLATLEEFARGDNRQRVADIMEDVDHMSKLVNELLAFSRAEMNKIAVRLESMELAPLIQAALKREVRPETEVIAKIDPEIYVMASAELLTRALANLIRNAVKYAGNAGPITLLAKRIKDEVSIEVQDSGPGVAETLINQLFEPFFRPEPSRNRDSGGVGLGLAIVKTCIEACNGTVSARNLQPKGFAVTIILKN